MNTDEISLYVNDCPPALPDEEIRQLFIDGSKEAKEKILVHNLRFVRYLVKRLFSNVDYPFDDLVSIGNFGLIKAVDTYDFTLGGGYKFATYATACIRNEILMFLRNLRKQSIETSLDAKVSEDSDGHTIFLLDRLKVNDDFVEVYVMNDVHRILRELVEELPDKEREIIKLRYGFYDKVYSQGEIGDILSISCSWVSKTEGRVIQKLRKKLEKEGICEHFTPRKKGRLRLLVAKNRTKTNVKLESNPPAFEETLNLELEKVDYDSSFKEEDKVIEFVPSYIEVQTYCGRDDYLSGESFFRKNDYVRARRCFASAIKDIQFREKSLAKLARIEMKEGKFDQARSLLNEYQDIGGGYLKINYGLLENAENNFERSKAYYSECMEYPEFQNKALLSLAKLYMQTGDYEIARKMFETLQQDSDFFFRATTDLFSLGVLERDFFECERLLNLIDTSKLTANMKKHYRRLDVYTKYFLGKLKLSDCDSFDNDYMISRLFADSDDLLLSHISRHQDLSKKMTVGCFLPDIDLKKLLMDARVRLEEMNGNHFTFFDMYRYRLDTPIGYKGEALTSDLCVTTILGTKDIITMYPISLSPEFDKEGASRSEKLKLKRLQGGIKNEEY